MANKRAQLKAEREERLKRANTLLCTIASTGRWFFLHKGRKTGLEKVSQFYISDYGRLWFHDSYTQEDVDIYQRYDWKNFTEGGGLRALIEALRDYINKGEQLHPRIGGYWGYRDDQIEIVRLMAIELGIAGKEQKAVS